MEEDSRYIIGIDLGTTHTSVAYVDTHHQTNPSLGVAPFSIPQLTGLGAFQFKPTLPSYCYLEEEEASFLLWKADPSFSVGHHALEQGGKTPTRLVASAKSWLCNGGAQRKERVLPLECVDRERKMSALQASTAYLKHIRDSWNFTLGKRGGSESFEEQEVVLTVPASFDEVARGLTVEAAKEAGLRRLTLLEEPQAAFYSWIHRHEQKWESRFNQGEMILVCDVGGGTTDFSLIEVSETAGKKSFQRVAVGQHLLLGGDNLDSAVAKQLEQEIGQELNTEQYLQLRHEARRAKEQLLSTNHPEEESFQAVLQGSGSALVKGSLTAKLTPQKLKEMLCEGFFGVYEWEEALRHVPAAGMRSTMGLPYESEPSVTKHLARFLERARGQVKGFKGVDWVLFNGGTMKPPLFQKGVMESLKLWLGRAPQQLASTSLDLAVSHGAAYYGRVRRGLGVRIGGGLPRSYYIAVEEQGEKKALCLLCRGSEEGEQYEAEQRFHLAPNRPVAFQLLSSQVRMGDRSGDLVAIQEEEMQSFPPIQTVLRYGKKQGKGEQRVPVTLRGVLTEVGTLEVWLHSLSTDHCWKLEFQLRTAQGSEDSLAATKQREQDELFSREFLEEAKALLSHCFSREGGGKPQQLFPSIEEALGMKRQEWKPAILRELWDALFALKEERKKSPSHEARWWNLAGYLLRPGYGHPLDDFRVKELWKVILSQGNVSPAGEVALQQWIALRRIAGGLQGGQQQQLVSRLLPLFLPKGKKRIQIEERKGHYAYTEQMRCVAAMEWLPFSTKERLGDALVARLEEGKGGAAEYWALSRLGARQLLYGGVGQVLPKEKCILWMEALKALGPPCEKSAFTLEQLARKSALREVDVGEEVREGVKAYLSSLKEESAIEKALCLEEALTLDTKQRMYGEDLPVGLMLADERDLHE